MHTCNNSHTTTQHLRAVLEGGALTTPSTVCENSSITDQQPDNTDKFLTQPPKKFDNIQLCGNVFWKSSGKKKSSSEIVGDPKKTNNNKKYFHDLVWSNATFSFCGSSETALCRALV